MIDIFDHVQSTELFLRFMQVCVRGLIYKPFFIQHILNHQR